MLQLFQTRDGPFFFHRHTCLHLSRFFCCIIKKYLSHILFWSQFVSVCFGIKFFSSFKIHCLQMLQLFQTRDGSFFFHCHTCLHLSRFFCCIIKKYLSHILFWSQFVSVCFGIKLFSSFKIHCLQMLQLFQTRDGPFFFHRHTCLHLSRFFCCIIKKYLSHILFWSQFVSVCSGMKFFSSFKIHCLQMLQLFQTRDGPFFFHCHTCLHLSSFFCCIIKKYLSHILFWSQFVSVCFAMKLFFSFKIHCLQMLQFFQTKDGPIFFIVTLVALFLLYHQKIIVPHIHLCTVRLSLFHNEILFLL